MQDNKEYLDRAAEQLAEMLEREGLNKEELKQLLEVTHPADLADLIEDMNEEEKVKFFAILDNARAAKVLDELEPSTKLDILKQVQDEKLSDIIGHMTPSAGADVLNLLPNGREAAVLSNVGNTKRQDLQSLLKYSPHTAGGLMTTNFVSIPESFTAEETLKAIQGSINVETIEYIYIVDDTDKLKGVCSMRSILVSTPETVISSIMRRDVKTVRYDLDQEEVANTARRYNLRAVPVVEDNNTLLGVVTLNNVLDVVHQEAEEDIMKMAGVSSSYSNLKSIKARVFARVPWLAITLAGELLLAYCMRFFNATIEEYWFLALFFPVNNAIAGNHGLQSSTIVTRGFATGEIKASKFAKILWDEITIGLLVGLSTGIVTGLFAYLLQWNWELGVVITISMTLGLTIAAISGIITPILFYKMGKDPALAAGPFISAMNDIICTMIYLLTAMLILK